MSIELRRRLFSNFRSIVQYFKCISSWKNLRNENVVVDSDRPLFVVKSLQTNILNAVKFRHRNNSLYLRNVFNSHQKFSKIIDDDDYDRMIDGTNVKMKAKAKKNNSFLVDILRCCDEQNALIVEPLLPWTSLNACFKRNLKNGIQMFSFDVVFWLLANLLRLLSRLSTFIHCDFHHGQFGIDLNFKVVLLDVRV
jgi:hypothetical protein